MNNLITEKQQDLQARFSEINKKNVLAEIMTLRMGRIDEAKFSQIAHDQHRRRFLSKDQQVQLLVADQVRAMVVAGFPEQLGLTEDEYRQSLPILEKRFVEGFPIPILVEPRVSADWQRRGMDNDFSPPESVDWVQNAPGIETPTDPYIVWAQDGKKYRGKTIDGIPFHSHERPLTFLEGLALYRAKPEIFFELRPIYTNEAFGISLGGSIAADGGIPFLYHNYFPLQDFGEFQVMPIYYPHANNTGGWPTCWNG